MATVQHSTVTDEVLDFLISAPTPEQIIAYHASETAQERLRMLLDANRSGTLSVQEKAELDEMNRVDHFFTLIKARAMKALKNRETAVHK
ncbi:MAG: hypothetical protein ACYDBJ_11430 [Aggregatilineales bacterium]